MNNQIKLAIIAIVIVIPIAAFAVIQTNTNSEIFTTENSKLQIITTSDSLLEFTQNVGGDKIDVTLLVSSGVDPHDWEPTIKDTKRMQKSDMVIINGLGLEHWITSLDTTSFSGIIVDTSNGVLTLDAKKYDKEKHDDAKEDRHIESEDGLEEFHQLISDEDTHDEDNHGSLDPHIWLNPVLAQMQVKNIANALSNSDPTNKNYYQSNAEMYLQELDSLDSKIRTDLSECRTDFVVFHNGFTYFAKEYGLTQHVIINSLDAHGDVTPQKLEKIISLAKELNIKVIFAEESTSTKTSQVIADEIGGKVLVLSPLEIISDETYIEKMTQNLESLKSALC